MTQSDSPAATKDQHFSAYLDLLARLREERVTLREVLEREILLGFIRINRSSINEFPLLETQQQTVIELMCQRLDHPAYDYIKKLTGNFVALLSHYRKAVETGDAEQKAKTGGLLSNTEALLIKSMQGIVYSIGLITDNFEELVIRLNGKQAMDDFSEMLKAEQMSPAFWKKFMQRFVVAPVARGHEAMLAEKRFSLSKEGKMLAVRLPMDVITEQMNPTNANMDKTRIQKAFEATIRDHDIRRVLKLVQTVLVKSLSFIPANLLSTSDVGSIARIVCIDPTSQAFHDTYLHHLQNKTSITQEQQTQLKFLQEQITAVGVGAAIGVSITRQNIEAALMGLVPGTVKAFTALGRDFRVANIKRLLQGLLEEHFILRLQEQAGEDLGKLQMLKSRAPRVPLAEVSAMGLSKIRMAKLFRADKTDPGHLLFRPRNDGELAAMIKLLQLEAESAKKIVECWKSGNEKVEVLLLIDLAALQRTTTNLQVRIQELLSRFRFVESAAKAAPAPGQPEPEQQPTTPE